MQSSKNGAGLCFSKALALKCTIKRNNNHIHYDKEQDPHTTVVDRR